MFLQVLIHIIDLAVGHAGKGPVYIAIDSTKKDFGAVNSFLLRAGIDLDIPLFCVT